jgi:hypothetical protein
MKPNHKEVRRKNFQKEERTALSLIMGLRLKFAKERDEPKTYTSIELYKLISQLLTKVSKEKIEKIIRENELETRSVIIEDELINKKIRQSKIFRVNWKDIFGQSLTVMIHRLRNSGKTVEETYKALSTHPNLIEFLKINPRLKDKYLENLQISVHSRYIENKTAESLK